MTVIEKYRLIAAELRERAAHPSLKEYRATVFWLARYYDDLAANAEATAQPYRPRLKGAITFLDR